MLQGICVDNQNSMVLRVGERYFLFPNGKEHFYVSRFPHKGSHTGCFQTKHFRIEELRLNPEKVYKASLMWTGPGYRSSTELKDYYIVPRKTHGYFYTDITLKKCEGCFPLAWFTNFEDVVTGSEDNVFELDEAVTELLESELISPISVHESERFEQLSLF